MTVERGGVRALRVGRPPRCPTLTPVGSDPSHWAGTHIEFSPTGPSATGKTFTWDVIASGGVVLGEVSWFARWRKYSFFPASNCVFEETCLSEIAEFVKARTYEQRTGL